MEYGIAVPLGLTQKRTSGDIAGLTIEFEF